MNEHIEFTERQLEITLGLFNKYLLLNDMSADELKMYDMFRRAYIDLAEINNGLEDLNIK